MDPTEIIRELCRKYGVPLAFGEKLRPLIQRSQEVEPELHDRIRDLVERSFAQEAARVRREREKRGERPPEVDRQVLRAVASILHAWEPPGWLETWGRQTDREGDADEAG